MDCLEHENSAPGTRKRALDSVGADPQPTSSIGAAHHNEQPTNKRRMHNNRQPGSYIKGLRPRERVDMILSELQDKHRWTFKDLVYHMATAEPTKSHTPSTKLRKRIIGDGILNDHNLFLQFIQSASTGGWEAVSSVLTSRIHSELDSLCKPGAGLGQYDSEFNIEQLDIPQTVQQVRQTAPALWTLLGSFMEAKRPSTSRVSDPKFEGYIMMICAILAYGRFPKTTLTVPTLIGLHLHSMGVKRRTLQMLSGLGLIPSYPTIMMRIKEIATRGEVRNDSAN